jgi:acyl carrier protein
MLYHQTGLVGKQNRRLGMSVPSVNDIIDVIIDLLAQDASRDPKELKADLEALGEQLPVDSILAAEVLARVEQMFYVKLPATLETSRNLRSVVRFAQAIHALALEQELQAGATA